MRVAGSGQSEVAAIFGAVARLLERAQHEVAQDALFGFSFDLRDQLLIIAAKRCDMLSLGENNIALHILRPSRLRMGVAEALYRNRADAERIAEVRGDFFELHDAFGVGLFVDAEDRWDPGLFEMRSNGFVGREHELFDDAVRDVAGAARDPGHFAEFVEFDRGSGMSKSMAPRRMRFLFRRAPAPASIRNAVDQALVAFAQGCVAFEQA